MGGWSRSSGRGCLRRSAAALRAAFGASLVLGAIAVATPARAQVFNGSQTTPNGAVNGGGGVWDNTTTNWTDFFGSTSTVYDPASAGVQFGSSGPSIPASGGTVTVTPGGVQLTGLIGFDITGDGSIYTIQGGDLRLAPGGTTFVTADVTGTDDPSAVIASRIVGSDGINVQGAVPWRCSARTPIRAALSSAIADPCSSVMPPIRQGSSAPSPMRAYSASSMPTRRGSPRS